MESGLREVEDCFRSTPKMAPWTSRKAFKGAGMNAQAMMTERVKDLLDCVTLQRLKTQTRLRSQSLEDFMKGTYVDISQSHVRKSFSSPGNPAPTITTSTILYSFDLDSVILPTELFRWHGYPRTLKMPDRMEDVKSLVGNGMAAPCLAQCIVSLCVLLHEVRDGDPVCTS